MVSTRVVRALFVALSVSASAQASWISDESAEGAFEARQVDIILSSASAQTSVASPTSVATPTQTSTTPSAAETTSAATTPTTAAPTTAVSTTDAVTTPTVAPTTNTTPTGAISSTAGGTGTTPTTAPTSQTTVKPNQSTTSATPTQFTESETTIMSTVVITLDNGSTSASVTAIPTKTSVPLATGSGQGDEATQAKNKSIIIGVCVGVGGAIVLAVAGVLFWRLRNRRRQEVDHDELQSFGTGYGAAYGAPSTAEKSEAGGASNSTRSPFQSTLESYHAPTQTNTASNF